MRGGLLLLSVGIFFAAVLWMAAQGWLRGKRAFGMVNRFVYRLW